MVSRGQPAVPAAHLPRTQGTGPGLPPPPGLATLKSQMAGVRVMGDGAWTSLACTQSSWSEATWPRCAQACLPQVQVRQPGLGPGARRQQGGGGGHPSAADLLRPLVAAGDRCSDPPGPSSKPCPSLRPCALVPWPVQGLAPTAGCHPDRRLLGCGKSVWGLSSCTLTSLKENDPHRRSSEQTQPLCSSGDWSWCDFGDSWESRSPDLTPSCSGAPPSATCSWGHQAG